MRHQKGCYHSDFIRERKEEKETLQEMQQRVEYPIGCPVSELGCVLLSLPVVPEIEKCFIYRNNQSAKNVYEYQEERT